MNLLRTWSLGLIGLLALTSCGLFSPEKPYTEGSRSDPKVLDLQHPEKRRARKAKGCKPVDYLLPWRLADCKR